MTQQLFRYILIGGLCAISDVLVLYFLVEFFHIWYLFSAITSFTIVSLLGYFGQKKFTFKDNSKNHKRQLSIFFLVAGTGLLINSACMFFFVSVASVWYIYANVVTKLIVLFWNFAANKYITFKPFLTNEE